ncbi:MAG: hypothetical protein ABIJ16_01910 [Bacteroidota bacterium]
MKPSFYLLLFCTGLFLVSCNNSTGTEDESNPADSSQTNNAVEDTSSCSAKEDNSEQPPDFSIALQEVLTAFNRKDSVVLDKYIHPAFGIKVLDNPGAYIVIYQHNSFSEFFNGNTSFDANFMDYLNIECVPEYGDIPYYDCDSGWDKEGCFWSDHATKDIGSLYKALVQCELAEDNDDIYETHLIAGDLITHGFYCTDKFTGFYFALRNNNWYLLCIDMVDPCSA